MTPRNLAWLRDELSWTLNTNPTQTDQDFNGPASDPYKYLDKLLNEAYSREVNAAKIEVGAAPFTVNTSFTWAAGSATYVLPDYLVDQQIDQLTDETDSTPGAPLWVGNDRGQSTTLSWRNRTTLQWGTSGPGSARTITAFFNARAEEMHRPLAEPLLIPYEHRHLLVWSAAIIGRAKVDEQAPAEWLRQHTEARSQYHTLLARGTIVYPSGNIIRVPDVPGIMLTASTSTAGIGGGIG